MTDVRCGVMWTGDAWVLVTTTAFGDLITLNTSPEITDAQVHAMRSAASHGRTHFLGSVGGNDELRMWFSQLSDEQHDRLQYVLGRFR